MRKYVLIILVFTCGLVFGQGSGLILYEVANTGTGNANAGASALATDASSAYTNPAALTELDNNYLSVGIQLLPLTIELDMIDFPTGYGTDDASGSSTAPSLGIYWAHKINDKFTIGGALNAIAASSVDYDEDWKGRFVVTNGMVAVVNFEPSVAYRLNETWSFGLGFNFYYSLAETNLRLPVITADGGLTYDSSLESKVNAEGATVSVGFSAGVHYRMNEATRLGLTYRMGSTFEYDAEVVVTELLNTAGTFTRDLTAEVAIVNGINLGLAHRIANVDLLADAGWSQWSAYDDTPVTLQLEGDVEGLPSSVTASLPRDWDDTWRIAIGANYYLDEKWTLQCGLSYDSSVVDETTQAIDIPGFAAFRYAAGGIYNLSDKFNLGLHYSYLDAVEGEAFTHYSAFGDIEAQYSKMVLQTLLVSFSYKY